MSCLIDLHLSVRVKILKLQNRCHIVVRGGKKSMCLAVTGRLQGRTAKLLLARWLSRYYGTEPYT